MNNKYNILTDETLSNDYHLMLAYYSKLEEYPDKIKFTKRQIKDTLKPIMLEMADREITFYPNEYRLSAKNIFDEIAEEIGLSATLIEKAIKTPFGHPAGKKYLRKEIIPRLPEAKRYVEPFCGACSILFGIDDGKYEEEIINDLEKEYISAFKFFKSMTEDDLNKLKQYKWISSKSFFNELKDKQFKSNIENIGKFLYLSWNSFNRMRKNYSPILGDPIKRLERIYAQVKPRLENVTILNKDALDVIKQYDSVDTIHYMDPPYPGKWDQGFGKDEFDVKELAKVLKNIKGKFLLSLEYDKAYEDLFKQYNIIKVDVPAASTTWVVEGRRSVSKEILIANYDIKNSITKISQQERLEALEETEGSWYLIEENGKKHPFVIQYHIRGIWHDTKQIKPMFVALKKNDMALAKKHLTSYVKELHPESEAKSKLDKALQEEDIDTLYEKVFKALQTVIIEKPLDELAKIMQLVDDKRGDVSGTLRKHVNNEPPKLNELKLNQVYNIGNIHNDFRIKHPTEDYLVGITNDVVKIAIQDIDNEVHYVLRNRLLENQADDNWLSQKKLIQPYPAWLNIVTPSKPEWSVPPTKTGATIETAGRYFFKASGHGYFGVAKTDYSEFWLFFDQNKYKRLNGRFDFKLIPLAKATTKVPEEAFWMMNRPPKSQVPYITAHDRDEEEAKAKKDKIEMIWNEALLDVAEVSAMFDKKRLLEDTNNVALTGSILKVKKYKQVIITPVLVPNEPDYVGDGISIEEVEKTAYDYMEKGRKIGLMHKGKPIDAIIVESRILRRDEIENGIRTPKGTWEAGIKINDDKVWKMILDGTLKGVSIQGYGFRRKV